MARHTVVNYSRRVRKLAVGAAAAITAGAVAAFGSGSSGDLEPVNNASAFAVVHQRPSAPDPGDPGTWTPKQLAAELVLAGIDMGELDRVGPWARSGIGGIVLFGSPRRSLRRQLRVLQSASPHGMLITSDEEGGLVQRLTAALGPLPSAKRMSVMGTAKTRRLAQRYGAGMSALGVNVDLAPVADLGIPGAFISHDRRAYSATPMTVAGFVNAFQQGLQSAGVMPVVKHWPGHGHSADTHVGSGRTPRWTIVQRSDLIPFNEAIRAGVPSVMVGHLIVPGLTKRNEPASLSRSALAELRRRAGPNTLIMTDSLSMGAVTSALHQSTGRAALRALIAGADVALLETRNPMKIVNRIARAITTGALPHAQAVASAKRMLAAQQKWN